MATPQLHLTISAGASFSQSVLISNPDQSVTNLNGMTFKACMSELPGSFNALASTPTPEVREFGIQILDPSSGEIVITLSAEETSTLNKRKYLYSISMTDSSGVVTEIVGGQVFVRPAIGNLSSLPY